MHKETTHNPVLNDARLAVLRDEIGTMPDHQRHEVLQRLTWLVGYDVIRQAITDVEDRKQRFPNSAYL